VAAYDVSGLLTALELRGGGVEGKQGGGRTGDEVAAEV
jgi:hypothetical protein